MIILPKYIASFPSPIAGGGVIVKPIKLVELSSLLKNIEQNNLTHTF